MFHAGVAAVQAETCLPAHLPRDRPVGRTVLFALGKAAGQMAQVAFARIAVDKALIVTRTGHMPPGWTPPPHARVIEAGHPCPDDASLEAGKAAEALVSKLARGDRLIALISGGGSALMVAPVPGVSLAEKQAVNRALLAAGVPIAEMNRIRAALSRLKGGQMAALAHPAEVLTFVISDVPGDDPALVASGPTCAMPAGEDPRAIAERYGIELPQGTCLSTGRADAASQAPGTATVVAQAADALAAMSDVAARAGYEPIVLGDCLEGQAADLAREHARLALDLCGKGRRIALISGGETTVPVSGKAGVGGRNLTYCLALAIALGRASGISAMAADSDGIDGTSPAAGAVVLPTTLDRLAAAGLSADRSLAAHDSFHAFAAIGDTIVCGPTGTNVNDLRAILIDPA